MLSFVQLSRPWAAASSAVLVLVSYYVVDAANATLQTAALATLGVMSMCSAGFALNDYVDHDIDRLAHPERVLVRGLLTRPIALRYSLVLFGIGLTSFGLLGLRPLVIGLVAFSILLGYSRLKRTSGLLANASTALLTGLAGSMGLWIGGSGAEGALAGALLGVSSFLIILPREMLKDIEDYAADACSGRNRTMPALIGVANSYRVAGGLLFLAATSVLVPRALSLDLDTARLILNGAAFLVLILVGARLFSAAQRQARFFVKVLRVVMILYLVGIAIGSVAKIPDGGFFA